MILYHDYYRQVVAIDFLRSSVGASGLTIISTDDPTTACPNVVRLCTPLALDPAHCDFPSVVSVDPADNATLLATFQNISQNLFVGENVVILSFSAACQIQNEFGNPAAGGAESVAYAFDAVETNGVATLEDLSSPRSKPLGPFATPQMVRYFRLSNKNGKLSLSLARDLFLYSSLDLAYPPFSSFSSFSSFPFLSFLSLSISLSFFLHTRTGIQRLERIPLFRLGTLADANRRRARRDWPGQAWLHAHQSRRASPTSNTFTFSLSLSSHSPRLTQSSRASHRYHAVCPPPPLPPP